MSPTIRRLTRLTALAVALLLTAAACGGESDSSSEVSDEAEQAEDGAGQAGDHDADAVLRVGADMGTGGLVLDNTKGQFADISRTVNEAMFDSMIHDGTNGPEPGLATEWTAPDASTVELTLREGVEFQDGTPFNAEAVKFSWDLMMAQADQTIQQLPWFAALESVDVVNSEKVRVNLNAPLAGEWINDPLRGSNVLTVMSPTAVRELGDAFWDDPVGAGPYSFESHQPEQQLELRRWDGYWDPDSQLLGGVDVVQSAPGAPGITALRAGEIDAVLTTTTDAAGLEGESGFQVITSNQFPTMVTLQVCTSKTPFDTLEGRQALAHAINREELNTGAFGGAATESQVPWPQGSDLRNDEVADAYDYDPDKARELLRSAGVAEGAKFTLLDPGRFGPEVSQVVEILQQQLAKVGLEAEISRSADFVTDIRDRDPELAVVNYAQLDLNNVLPPDTFLNLCDYNNEDITSALQDIGAATGEDLAGGWQRLQQALADDLPLIVLLLQPNLMAADSNVQGLEVLYERGKGFALWDVSIAPS